MNDFVHSYDNLLEAQESAKALKMALQKGRFHLTKFISSTTDAWFTQRTQNWKQEKYS